MKNAIVTGATRGIGLATAEMLLKEGYFVTVTYAYDEPSVRNSLGRSDQQTGDARLCPENERERPY